MPAQEALAETEQMTAASVSAALSAMKPEQAAQLVQVMHLPCLVVCWPIAHLID
jgi:flagellar motility protein MotE (MotC chaperone)